VRVHEILRLKGDSVYQISPDATLADVVERLVKYNIGSLVVSDKDSVVGIITERDILRTVAAQKGTLEKLLVRDVMTRDMVIGSPDADVGEVMGTMTSRRVRHLPIMCDGRLCGMISIGDVVKAQFDSLAVENHYLKVYIQS
jgi:CBS domain-containing protein